MKLISRLLFVLFLIIVTTIINKYRSWLLGSWDEFNNWHPNYGIYLFIGKTFFLIIFIIILSYTLYRCIINFPTIKIRKYIIYFSIIIITSIVGEFYPFSFYPMYNNFPNWAYTFYFVDENNQSLSDYLKDNHGNISHIYFAEFNSRGWTSGGERESKKHLNFIGKRIVEKSLDITQLKRDGVKEIKLKRINNHFVENELKIDTTLICSYDLNGN